MFGKKEEKKIIDQNKIGELLQLATLASVLKTQSFLTTNGYNHQERVVQLTERTIWTTSVALLTQALRLSDYNQYQQLVQQTLVNYLQDADNSKFDLETVNYVLKTFQSQPQQFNNYLDGMTNMARQSLMKKSLPIKNQLLTLTNKQLKALYYNISTAISLHLPNAKLKIASFSLTANTRFYADAIQLTTMVNMLGFEAKSVFSNLHDNDLSTDKSLSTFELDFYKKYVNSKNKKLS